MLIHPLVDGGIVVLRTVESKQFCFHCRRVTLISNYPPRSQNRDLGHPPRATMFAVASFRSSRGNRNSRSAGVKNPHYSCVVRHD
jgi:hypothetical protein